MDRADHLDALSDDIAAFYAAVSSVDLGSPVPSCPGWTVADLTYHLGEVQHFWGEIAARSARSPDGIAEPARPPDAELVTWGRRQSARLEEVLAAADPDAPVWTWSGPQTTSWIVRRMAHETAVHRWDAQRAAGTPRGIRPELASDGIDEFLTYFLFYTATDAPALAGSVHLHATDTPGEWLVSPGDDGTPVVVAEHAKGAAAVRGPASDLLLALWRRVGLDEVEVIGDRAAADEFIAHASNA